MFKDQFNDWQVGFYQGHSTVNDSPYVAQHLRSIDGEPIEHLRSGAISKAQEIRKIQGELKPIENRGYLEIR